MDVRLAGPDDANQLAVMRWQSSLEDPEGSLVVNKEQFVSRCQRFLEDRLTDGSWSCWVATEGPMIISHAFVETILMIPRPWNRSDHYGYLTNFYTRPQFRGQGVGTRLLSELVRWASSLGFELLIVWPSERSIPLYERAGFSSKNEILELSLRPTD